MIQENYQISVTHGEDCAAILGRLGECLEKIRESEAYREASGIYVRLLMPQISMRDAGEVGAFVRDSLPKAVVAGISMTFFPKEPEEPFLFMNCSYFAHAQVTLLEHVGRPVHYKTAGRNFGRRIAQMKDVKGVEIFCVGLNIDVSRFVIGVAEENADVPFFGSLAGSFMDRDVNPEFVHTSIAEMESHLVCYILGNKLYDTGIVMAVFSGEELHVQADCLLGWKPLGKEMVVTKAISRTCIATIDGIPATEVYRKYLNVPPDERFLENVCEFPMITERDGFLIARTPPLIDTDGKLYFNADVHEGEKYRLSYANSGELLQETREASERMWEFRPEGVFICACTNRLAFLKGEAVQEMDAYRRMQPQFASSYGAGEIYRHRGKGGMLNSSFVVVGMREGERPEDGAILPELPRLRPNKRIPLSTRLAVFLDATTRELKESNRKLQDMAEAAQAATIAKSQFLSNMSHEIRTPINAILGMDVMILREETSPAILEYAENIRTAGNSLLGLVNDVLDFSKSEAGKLDIIPVEYSLSSMLNDLVDTAWIRAEKKGLNFVVNVPEDIPNILLGDELRIRQVIMNILTNAVKYTKQGTVTFSMDYEKQDAASILLKASVRDTGIGIKEEDLAKLFTAFERIEEERNRAIEGTGLGMNITQCLLNLMGSKLEVESVYGRGSVFSFVLKQEVLRWEPMGNFGEACHHMLERRPAYREAFTAPGARLLVVDDTPVNLTVVKGLLKRTRMQIDTAGSGRECLRLVGKNRYDIIFLDHRMPEMDGIETMRRMRETAGNPNKDTPVISLTANVVSGARNMYIDAGFRDYLTKPINGTQLENMILKYLPPEKVVPGDVPFLSSGSPPVVG